MLAVQGQDFVLKRAEVQRQRKRDRTLVAMVAAPVLCMPSATPRLREATRECLAHVDAADAAADAASAERAAEPHRLQELRQALSKAPQSGVPSLCVPWYRPVQGVGLFGVLPCQIA